MILDVSIIYNKYPTHRFQPCAFKIMDSAGVGLSKKIDVDAILCILIQRVQSVTPKAVEFVLAHCLLFCCVS